MNSPKPIILIIDDDIQVCKMLKSALSPEGFKIKEANNSNEGGRLAASIKPDLILLDLELPELEGMALVNKIREWSNIPIIILSEISTDDDIVEAFEAGANDYVVKPFNMNILIARIRSAMRDQIQEEVGEVKLEVGNIVINLLKHEVTKNNKIVEFSPKEYELLAYFVRNKGKMLTHRQLLREVWGEGHAHDIQYLRVYIGQIRQKIEEDVENPSYIVTESGVGYRLDNPSE